MIIPDDLRTLVESYPDLEDGSLCFKGTSVLVFDFINTLTLGLKVEDFLRQWPQVSREQAQAWLDWDDRERAKRAEDDLGHLWALKLVPPSYMPSRQSKK